MHPPALALLEERVLPEYKPRLRPDVAVVDLLPDEHPARESDQTDAPKRYDDSGFVGAMIERQFGSLVRPPSLTTFEHTLPRMRLQGGSEPYYAALTGLLRLCVGSIDRDQPTTHLDIGTGVGRLVASSTERVQLGLGLDLFQIPLTYAHRLVVESNSFEIPIRTTRNRQRAVTLAGLGRRSAVFARGDAHHLPVMDGSFTLVSCCNVLHRVRDPSQVLAEAMRVTSLDGYLIISNSYDWDDEYTDSALWFDDVVDLIGSPGEIGWSIETRIDPIPYLSRIHDRKYTYALNDILLLRRVR